MWELLSYCEPWLWLWISGARWAEGLAGGEPPFWLAEASRAAYCEWTLFHGSLRDRDRLVALFASNLVLPVTWNFVHGLCDDEETGRAIAGRDDSVDVVSCVLQIGAPRTGLGDLVCRAAEAGDVALLQWLFAQKELYDRLETSWCDALCACVRHDDVELCSWLMQTKGSLVCLGPDPESRVPVIVAFARSHLTRLDAWAESRTLRLVEAEWELLTANAAVESKEELDRVRSTFAQVLRWMEVGACVRRAAKGVATLEALSRTLGEPFPWQKAPQCMGLSYVAHLWSAAGEVAKREPRVLRVVYVFVLRNYLEVEADALKSAWVTASATGSTEVLDEMLLLFPTCPVQECARDLSLGTTEIYDGGIEVLRWWKRRWSESELVHVLRGSLFEWHAPLGRRLALPVCEEGSVLRWLVDEQLIAPVRVCLAAMRQYGARQWRRARAHVQAFTDEELFPRKFDVVPANVPHELLTGTVRVRQPWLFEYVAHRVSQVALARGTSFDVTLWGAARDWPTFMPRRHQEWWGGDPQEAKKYRLGSEETGMCVFRFPRPTGGSRDG